MTSTPHKERRKRKEIEEERRKRKKEGRKRKAEKKEKRKKKDEKLKKTASDAGIATAGFTDTSAHLGSSEGKLSRTFSPCSK